MINRVLQNQYLSLIILKLGFCSLLFYILAYYLHQDFFAYPDYFNVYMHCNQTQTNVLFTKFLCSASWLSGAELSPSSFSIIILAGIINTFITLSFYYLFKDFLRDTGKFLFIICLSLHPYLAIYFFRFYTEIFASLGMLLIAFYAVKKIKPDFLFILATLLLINFRNALIPVFLVYAMLIIYQNLRSENSESSIYAVAIIIFCVLSLFTVLDFGHTFVNLDDSYSNSITSNLIYTLGFRESVAGDGVQALLQSGFTGKIQFSLSMILVLLHSIGIIGLLLFSLKNFTPLLATFAYLVMPLLTVSHMRYLLPLMPIIIFGLCYIFLSKKGMLEY